MTALLLPHVFTHVLGDKPSNHRSCG